MKSLIKFTRIVTLLSVVGINSVHAGFDSLYVFGDSISCTAKTNISNPSLFYGGRYSNGKVWVEALAQMQGISNFDPAKSPCAFYGNTSTNLFNETKNYPPAGSSNALVVIWVNNADFVDPTVNDAVDRGAWPNLINNATNGHYKAITNLYLSKNVRHLMIPNVVDISTVPFANQIDANKKKYVRQKCLDYNAALSTMLDGVQRAYPNLVIYRPDFAGLLADMMVNQNKYGLANVYTNGTWLAATTASAYYPNLPVAKTNGYGTNYIFWDETDPTAKVHYIMARVAQQLVSPAKIGSLSQINGSNRLEVINMPVGTTGYLENATNLAQSAWTVVATFTNSPIYVPTPPLPADFGEGLDSGNGGGLSGPPMPGSGGSSTATNAVPFKSVAQFYRLSFPLN